MSTKTAASSVSSDPKSHADPVAHPGPSDLAARIVQLNEHMASCTFEMLRLIAEADATGAWALDGSLSCAAWLTELCEIELSTARHQIRVSRAMVEYRRLFTMMESGELSYAKARMIVAHLTPESVDELLDLARFTPLRGLGAAISAWSHRNEDQESIDERHYEARSMSWRTDSDGMVTVTIRLQPAVAGDFCAVVDQAVMRADAPAGASLSQQRADALHAIATNGGGRIDTEVVVHVRGDGNTLADGTPLTDHAVGELLPDAFVSLLIHDSARQPIDASPRRRMPTRRQRRVIDELNPVCQAPGCTSSAFLQYDHKEPFAKQGKTVLENLQRLCGPHNRAKEPEWVQARAR